MLLAQVYGGAEERLVNDVVVGNAGQASAPLKRLQKGRFVKGPRSPVVVIKRYLLKLSTDALQVGEVVGFENWGGNVPGAVS